MPTQTTTTRETVLANVTSLWRCTARPGLWRVLKVNPTNIKLENTETKQRLNAHPSYLYLADGVLDEAPVDVVPFTAAHNPGTVVRFKPSPKAPEGLFVIVRDSSGRTGEPTYSVHPLGGSSRYYRGVSHRALDVVTGTVTVPAAV